MAFKRSAVRSRLSPRFQTKIVEIERFQRFFLLFPNFLEIFEERKKGLLERLIALQILVIQEVQKWQEPRKHPSRNRQMIQRMKGEELSPRSINSYTQTLQVFFLNQHFEPFPTSGFRPPISPLVFWLRKVFQYNSVQNVDWFSLYCIIFLKNK